MRTWQVRGGCLVPETAPAVEGPLPHEKDTGVAAAGEVWVLDRDEAASRATHRTERLVLDQLPHAQVPYVEWTRYGAVGALSVPHEGGRVRDTLRIAFRLDAQRLVLVDDRGACVAALERMGEERVRVDSVAGALCLLMRALARSHPALLSRVREDFETFEERLVEGHRVDRRQMMRDSRRLLGLDAFFQGMADIAAQLADEDDSFVEATERLRFKGLSRFFERLGTRLESVQDYSLQVHGLYQEAIDIQQNRVMQWLTVIATIFMPLTFITGWYGMNFPHMVMIDAPWGYAAVVLACALIVIAEVAFFHRRGWLGRRHRVRGTRREESRRN